jgi:hypothetical protein
MVKIPTIPFDNLWKTFGYGGLLLTGFCLVNPMLRRHEAELPLADEVEERVETFYEKLGEAVEELKSSPEIAELGNTILLVEPKEYAFVSPKTVTRFEHIDEITRWSDMVWPVSAAVSFCGFLAWCWLTQRPQDIRARADADAARLNGMNSKREPRPM